MGSACDSIPMAGRSQYIYIHPNGFSFELQSAALETQTTTRLFPRHDIDLLPLYGRHVTFDFSSTYPVICQQEVTAGSVKLCTIVLRVYADMFG
jgi:hypothetical protein